MFSSAHLEKLGSAFKTTLGLRGKGESTFGMVAGSAARGLTTFGMAYANGRFCEPGKTYVEVGGVPIDLLAGGLLQVGALIGFFGQYDQAAHVVGDGLSSVYLARMGQQMGATHRIAQASGTPATQGMLGTVTGAPALYSAVPAMHAPHAAPAMANWAAV